MSRDKTAEIKLFPKRSNQHLISEYGGRRRGPFVLIDGDRAEPTNPLLNVPDASVSPPVVHIDIDLDENDFDPNGLGLA
ncbi:MAG: hypothetical protein EOP83_06580 [Verrucomicrobiaceae bacterium]|nr:MAG: hypothetical protein EOP83_06580 [Verrucomicrobiaceae bacterium]